MDELKTTMRYHLLGGVLASWLPFAIITAHLHPIMPSAVDVDPVLATIGSISIVLLFPSRLIISWLIPFLSILSDLTFFHPSLLTDARIATAIGALALWAYALRHTRLYPSHFSGPLKALVAGGVLLAAFAASEAIIAAIWLASIQYILAKTSPHLIR